MWYVYAFISALFYSFRGVLEKSLVHQTNKYVLGLGVRLFALPFFFLPLIFDHRLIVAPAHLTAAFWFPVLFICLISTPLENFFYYEALKEEELSLALPILSLAPAVTIVIAMLVLHQVPSLMGVLGIFLIISGIYALKIKHAREGLWAPLVHLRRSRGVRLMLVVMVSLALGSILDTIAVRASNPFFYAMVNYVTVCLVLFALAWVKARKDLWQLRKHVAVFGLIGLIVASYTIFYLLALSLGITAYVIAIKNSSILFSIVFGVVLLREKDRRAKLLAGALIFAGLVCIKVFG